MDLLLWGRGLEEAGVGGHHVHVHLAPSMPLLLFYLNFENFTSRREIHGPATKGQGLGGRLVSVDVMSMVPASLHAPAPFLFEL